jgi:hypothetical protein
MDALRVGKLVSAGFDWSARDPLSISKFPG